mgnify:CR=1 FL=1
MPDTGSWTDMAYHVQAELTRLANEQEKIRMTIDALRAEQATRWASTAESLAALKVKSGIWGAIGGSIPVVIMLVIYLFKP